jgi:hypothetical protein
MYSVVYMHGMLHTHVSNVCESSLLFLSVVGSKYFFLVEIQEINHFSESKIQIHSGFARLPHVYVGAYVCMCVFLELHRESLYSYADL